MRKRQFVALVLLLAANSFPAAASGPDLTQDGGGFVEISSKIAMNAMIWAAKSGKTKPLVVEHELKDVTPEMITWWWDNIQDTERYKLWHPKDHIAFEWVVTPTQGHVGAIQKATEKIGGMPMTFLIRWEDPKSVKTEYQNVLAASIISDDGNVIMRFSHEYEATPYGVHMRSTFHVPGRVSWIIRSGLRKHNIEEMARFSEFLPDLYLKNTN
jgi:hypothetical protein